MMSNYIKVSEYAKQKGVTTRTVYRWSKNGDIEVEKIDGVMHVKVGDNSNTDDDIVSILKSENCHLKEEIEYLRKQLEQAQQALNDAQERHDMIVAQLSQQNTKMLEDMRNRTIWTKIKTALGFSTVTT